jgi:hypothetical protein
MSTRYMPLLYKENASVQNNMRLLQDENALFRKRIVLPSQDMLLL